MWWKMRPNPTHAFYSTCLTLGNFVTGIAKWGVRVSGDVSTYELDRASVRWDSQAGQTVLPSAVPSSMTV